jgi:succinate dehydrogenase / fumarate reductase cytochrome b subunit
LAVLTSLVLTITETLRYRGAVGQWSWVLHRIAGLGVVLFVTLHVIDTSWSVFYPGLYVKAIAVYQTPLFTIGEFALIACVVYHAFNGLRIVVFDYNPRWWKHQQRAAVTVLAATIVVLIPVFVLMFGHVRDYYSSNPDILPLSVVLESQLPFIAGAVAAIIAALFASVIFGAIAGQNRETKRQGSAIERFWWAFMRVSGLLIIPLVFGHLALMHVIQGVFDITAQNHIVVGTELLNRSGTAVEFVSNRWNLLIGPVAIWRLYDFGLLALVVLHGFNGLRYVLTDYSSGNPMVRRAMRYVTIIGAVTLLVVGIGALIGSIDQTAIAMAEEALAKLPK